jgi:hypothetical protein
MDVDDSRALSELSHTADNITATNIWAWVTKRNNDLYKGQIPNLTPLDMVVEDAHIFNEYLARSLNDYLKQLSLTSLQECQQNAETTDNNNIIESKEIALISTSTPIDASQPVATCSAIIESHNLQTEMLPTNITKPSQTIKFLGRSSDAMDLDDTPYNLDRRADRLSSKESTISESVQSNTPFDSATSSIQHPVTSTKHANDISANNPDANPQPLSIDTTPALISTIESELATCKGSNHNTSSVSAIELLLRRVDSNSNITTPLETTEQPTTKHCETIRKRQLIPPTSSLSGMESLFVNLLPMPKDARYYEQPFNKSTTSSTSNSTLFKRRRLG